MSDIANLSEGNRCLRLEGTSWILGRQAPADLIFNYPQVSRLHARLERREGGYFITDLESRYGTFCAGKEVGQEPVRVRDGNELVLGGAVKIMFSDPGETKGGMRVGRLTGLWLDESTADIWVDGRMLSPPLSSAQYSLLSLLQRREGSFFSRDEVCAALWPDQCRDGVSEEALDALIKRVRSRLREIGGEACLEVRRGRGLRLVSPD